MKEDVVPGTVFGYEMQVRMDMAMREDFKGAFQLRMECAIYYAVDNTTVAMDIHPVDVVPGKNLVGEGQLPKSAKEYSDVCYEIVVDSLFNLNQFAPDHGFPTSTREEIHTGLQNWPPEPIWDILVAEINKNFRF